MVVTAVCWVGLFWCLVVGIGGFLNGLVVGGGVLPGLIVGNRSSAAITTRFTVTLLNGINGFLPIRFRVLRCFVLGIP